MFCRMSIYNKKFTKIKSKKVENTSSPTPDPFTRLTAKGAQGRGFRFRLRCGTVLREVPCRGGKVFPVRGQLV